jgi:hypothetical protein
VKLEQRCSASRERLERAMLRLSVSSLSPRGEVGVACAHVVFVFTPLGMRMIDRASAWQPIVAAPPVDLLEPPQFAFRVNSLYLRHGMLDDCMLSCL